jgi:hypothetical protein
MKLEQQVCSLELAKRLKELGVKQDGVTYFMDGELYFPGNLGVLKKRTDREVIAAFTVAELGEMFPQNFGTRYDGQGWSVYDGNGKYVAGMSADTEADARATMLIYLIENKLITLP